MLADHLDRADQFRLHLPDGPGPLKLRPSRVHRAARGRRSWPWTGMRDAVEIAGPLSAPARELFRALEPSIESFDPEHKLWDYELRRDDTVILSIGDYHDLQVELASRTAAGCRSPSSARDGRPARTRPSHTHRARRAWPGRPA